MSPVTAARNWGRTRRRVSRDSRAYRRIRASSHDLGRRRPLRLFSARELFRWPGVSPGAPGAVGDTVPFTAAAATEPDGTFTVRIIAAAPPGSAPPLHR
jgi:hypothetical protein